MPEGSGDVRAEPGAQVRGAHARVGAAHRLAARDAAGAPARRVWFVRDVLGIACAASVWVLVLAASGVLLLGLLLPSRDVAYGAANGALFHLLAFLGLAAHARAVFTDPGSVPAGAPPPPGSAPAAPQCHRCGSPKLEGASHCDVCGRCVRGMDHHCPWVNNCVGEDNQKYFVLFTLYMALASLHVLLLLAIPALRSHRRGEWDAHSTVSPRTSVLLLFLLALESFLFSSAMFGIQVHSICTDRTRTARLRRERGKSQCANLRAVFGGRFSLAWFSPFASPEPQNAAMHQDVV